MHISSLYSFFLAAASSLQLVRNRKMLNDENKQKVVKKKQTCIKNDDAIERELTLVGLLIDPEHLSFSLLTGAYFFSLFFLSCCSFFLTAGTFDGDG